MKLYVDLHGRIMAINATERTDLAEIEVDENAMDFPFKGWSESRICCYRVNVENGRITMMTPYVPTHMISALENLETKNAQLKSVMSALLGVE